MNTKHKQRSKKANGADGDTVGSPARVSLRSLYASAVRSVEADPGAAIAEYEAFLAELVEARRKRGD